MQKSKRAQTCRFISRTKKENKRNKEIADILAYIYVLYNDLHTSSQCYTYTNQYTQKSM